MPADLGGPRSGDGPVGVGSVGAGYASGSERVGDDRVGARRRDDRRRSRLGTAAVIWAVVVALLVPLTAVAPAGAEPDAAFVPVEDGSLDDGVDPHGAEPGVDPGLDPIAGAGRSGGTVMLRPAPGTVALTFDDGPHPVYTPQIMSILEGHGARGTFFVIGTAARQYPHLIADMVRRGHSVQNHTVNHPFLTRLSNAGITGELAGANDAIVAGGAPRPRCYRPPYGATDGRVRSIAAGMGLTEQMWNIDTADYTRPGAHVIRQRVAGARSGDIVLFHDGPANREQTVAALPGILADLRARGLRADTICQTWAEYGFFDVRPGHPFEADITRLVNRGLATGFADNTFRPGGPITRQAMATLLWRRSRQPLVWPDYHRFADVPPGHAFELPIAWLTGSGLATGYADNTFAPTALVSRQALAVMVWRLSGRPRYASAPPFRDVPHNHAFAEPIGWAAAAGLLRGYADGTFRPTAPVSRQAVAALVTRADAIRVP
ncbi:MAG: S-layer homology domain-containing protein [Acidimicrobiia bacterium]|nr:S-layer homology domain-containing protein [Acidimicrobiia bacterium]